MHYNVYYNSNELHFTFISRIGIKQKLNISIITYIHNYVLFSKIINDLFHSTAVLRKKRYMIEIP